MRYFELVIEGPEDEIKGFCLGVRASCCLESKIVFPKDEGIERAGLSEVLKKLITVKETSHVICDETIKDKLIRAIELDGTYKVRNVAELESASFEFKVNTFSREHADKIKELLKKLGEVELTLEKVEEEKRPDVKGLEVYAPAHDYKYEVKGAISGSFEKVYEVFTKFKKEPLIEVSTMELGAKS